jgi:hypothetical protein
MTPETDPRQEVETVVTPGKGVRRLPVDTGEATSINLARHRRDHALSQRHPARLGLPPVPRGVVERTTDDPDPLEKFARVVGMTDLEEKSRPRDVAREERPAPGRRERFVAAVSNTLATALGVAR